MDINGIRVITLEKFIELKLASGMTAAHRGQDLADVQKLIQERQLPLQFADRLDESVREGYRLKWQHAQVQDSH